MERLDWNKLKHSRWFWPVCAGIAAVCALGIALAVFARGILITATNENDQGVSPDTQFQVSGVLGLDEEGLRARITTQPAFAYQVSRDEGGGFLLTPMRPLEAGQTYTIKVGDKAFSFQVRGTLMVTSAFPADGSQKVPVRSGIEFEFNSRSIPLVDFQQALSVEPELKGSVTAGDGRFVFYPDGQMDYETTYTVTLSPPLETPGGAKLEEVVSFSFTTQSTMDEKAGYMFQLSGKGTYNSLTSETPLIQMYMDESLGGGDVSVKLYRFPGVEEYKDQLSSLAGRSYYDSAGSIYIDTEGLSEYASFEVTPFRMTEEGQGGKGYYSANQWLVQFPETLPEGWYAAEFTVTGQHKDFPTQSFTATRQMFLQVSDLSVFHMMSGQNLLLWVNDAATGQPVSGASMEVTGAYAATATTGEDGVASIGTGVLAKEENDYSGRDGGLFTVTAGGKTFADISWFYDYGAPADREARKYVSYLFTDRPIYRTTDTVKVWGMVRPRDAAAPAPETVLLDLADGAVVQEVKLEKNGLFTAQLSYEAMSDVNSSYLRLKLDEDVQLYSEYLEIRDFVKPVYTADAAPEKPVYLLTAPGADPALGVEVTFFDGTPAPGFAANTEAWRDNVSFPGGRTGLTTDGEGRLRIPMRFGEDESTNTWYPQSYGYTVSNSDAEAENFYLYGDIYVIHRDVMLRGSRAEDPSGSSRVEVTTHRVDVSRIRESGELWDYRNLQGAALSQPVNARLHRIYYTKEKTGTRYDFVSRTSVDSFRYTRHDDVVENYNFTTSGGSYVLDGLPESDEENCYYLELSTSDSTGKQVNYEIYLGSPYYWNSYGDDGIHRYVLDKLDRPGPEDVREDNNGFYYEDYNYIRSRFGDGEDVTFRLTDNDQEVTQLSGRLLYTVVQDDFTHTGVSSSADVKLPFSEKLTPNYVITGAYFDGKHVFALEDKYMIFDPEKRELTIALDTDKDAYRPADQVTVTATVTNKSTGKPAPQADLVLSVVDEAIFALREQYPAILSTIYRSVYYPTIQKYTSYTQVSYNGAGEKGGGGGEAEMRKDFKDTAQFLTAKTDASGKASFTFRLPDNITSWRLTGVALTDDGQAGDNKENVAATKEFFLSPIVSELSLDGDSFTVGLRGAGTGVTTQSTADYTVTVEGEDVQSTLATSGKVRDYQSVTFPALPLGDYTVTIRGECGGFADAVQLPFSVAESGIEVTMVKTFDLSQGVSVSPLRWPVTVAVYDQTLQAYNEVFRSLDADSWGSRADKRLARLFIARQFETEGSSWYDVASMEEGVADLITGEPIPLFPYGSPDMELTVKAAMSMPDVVWTIAAAGITPESMDASGGRRTVGYLAQALNENADAEAISALLENPVDLDFVDQMILATALAQAGDAEGAAGWYDKTAAPKLSKFQGLSGQEALYIPAQGQLTEGDCTAAASLLATACGHEDAAGLVRWLSEKESEYEPYVLERLFYLSRNQPKKDPKTTFIHENGENALVGAHELNENAKAQFSYVRDGMRVTKVLDRRTQRISFTKAQLAEADFRVPVGKVWADVYYAGSPSEGLDPAKKQIPLTKTIQPVGSDAIRRGSLVKITLTPDLSAFDGDIGDAELIIDDYIPTGMRFERYGAENNHNGSRGWWLTSRQGQRLKFTAWGYDSENTGISPIVYYARCAAPGDYVVESAYISSAVGETWGASHRDMVTIE